MPRLMQGVELSQCHCIVVERTHIDGIEEDHECKHEPKIAPDVAVGIAVR